MKMKFRDGSIFTLEKIFKNDNYISLWANYLYWGLGFSYSVGDSRIYITINLLCLHLDIWV